MNASSKFKLLFKLISMWTVLLHFPFHYATSAEDPKLQQAQGKMKQLLGQWRQDFREQESYLDILMVALLSKQHVMALGGPGGAKTATAQMVLSKMKGEKFTLQFSPSTKEELIKGALMAKKYLEEGIIEYRDEQSLLQKAYAILDEIDKGNPEVLAAALSVLNERKAFVGDKEIAGKLRTALVTSNMTLHEFLQKFRDTHDGPTGMAFLDRILFKVLVVNRLSSAKELCQLSRSLNGGHSGCGDFKDKNKDKVQDDDSDDVIDMEILQEGVSKIVIPPEVERLGFLLWERMAQVLQKRQKEEMELCQEDPQSTPYPYTMTNQYSTRGAMNLVNILKIGKYLEELKTKGEASSPSQIQLSPEDIQFAHYLMIMQGPGRLTTGTPQNPSPHPEGEFLGRIKRQFQHDEHTLKMLEDLRFERAAFAREYLEILKIYQEELKELAMDNLMSVYRGKNLKALTPAEKGALLKKIAQIEVSIQARRDKEREANGGEDVDGPAEVAREKVMAELEDLKGILKVDEKEVKKVIEEAVQEKAKEEEKKVTEQQDLEERTREIVHREARQVLSRVGGTPTFYYTGESEELRNAEISSRGDLIMSGSYKNGNVYIWNKGKPFFDLKIPINEYLLSAKFSPDGSKVITGEGGKIAHIWDAQTGKKLLTITKPLGWVEWANFSKDGKKVLTTNFNSISVWDSTSGKNLLNIDLTEKYKDFKVANFSPDGTKIVSGGKDGSLKIWDVTNGKLLSSLEGHKGEIVYANFSPSGDRILSVTSTYYDKTIRIWDLTTGKETFRYGGEHFPTVAADFDAEGKYIVGSDGKVVKIWDLRKGNEILQWEPKSKVTNVHFSPDGKSIVLANYGGKVEVWPLVFETDQRDLRP